MIYLVRHGKAGQATHDSVRPLTPHGVEESQKVGRFLGESGIRVEEIYHSTKLRARQTAQIMGEQIGFAGKLIEKEGLCPNDPVEPVAQWIHKYKKDIMIVGHMPFLGFLSSRLVLGDADRDLFAFRTAGAAILERGHGDQWVVAGFVVPEILK